MNYKNGYKVVYEVAANGERTFYASKSSIYPNADDAKLASFKDAEYAGKTIYEYEGEFYVADTAAAKFDKEGKPTGSKIDGFDKILVDEEAPAEASAPTTVNVEDEEPAGEPEVETDKEEDDEEPEVETEE